MPNPYDPTPWLARQTNRKPAYAFDTLPVPPSPADIDAWQTALRQRVVDHLGLHSGGASPLVVEQLSSDETPNYTRRAISFETRPGLRIFAYLLTPAAAPPPAGKRPALLCLHGHGIGVDPLVGLAPDGSPLEPPDYHNLFAIDAVERGYIVLAPEILGYGRRRQGEHAPDSPDSSCQTLSGAALMLGETLAAWRIAEAMRCLDYLQNRPDVDSLGVMGISGGGLITLFTAALDQRVRAAVVSGYLNTFNGSIMAISHCIDNFFPGLLQDAEMSDIAGLIAPRALWCENGEADPIFPIASFRDAAAATQKIYTAANAAPHFQTNTFPGDHHFDGTNCWDFLQRHLAS